MATVHPSRMALVPQDNKDTYPSRRERGRSSSPKYTSNGRHYADDSRRDGGRDGSRDRDRDYGYRPRDSGRHGRARADDYFNTDDKDERRRRPSRSRTRSRSLDRARDTEREERRERNRGGPRRPSPEYSEYRRPVSPPREREERQGSAGPGPQAPWRQQENMYPNRRDRPPHGGYGGGADFLERYALRFWLYFVVLIAHGLVVEDNSENPALSAYGLLPPKDLPGHCTSI